MICRLALEGQGCNMRLHQHARPATHPPKGIRSDRLNSGPANRPISTVHRMERRGAAVSTLMEWANGSDFRAEVRWGDVPKCAAAGRRGADGRSTATLAAYCGRVDAVVDLHRSGPCVVLRSHRADAPVRKTNRPVRLAVRLLCHHRDHRCRR